MQKVKVILSDLFLKMNMQVKIDHSRITDTSLFLHTFPYPTKEMNIQVPFV